MSVDPERYPLLAAEQETMWGSTRMRFVFEVEPPIPELVGNVRCACFMDADVVLIRTEEFGLSAFPGGVLEPGETWERALRRELLEEAGAHPIRCEVVGRLHFWSTGAQPYRPHLPHPEFQQVVTYAEVEVRGSPTNPPGGEHVLAVELVSIDRAAELIRRDDPFEAQLLSFVSEVRSRRLYP